jgi:hypothetical protein
LRLRLLTRDDQVPAAKAVIRHPQQRVGVRQQVDSGDVGLFVGNMVHEAGSWCFLSNQWVTGIQETGHPDCGSPSSDNDGRAISATVFHDVSLHGSGSAAQAH